MNEIEVIDNINRTRIIAVLVIEEFEDVDYVLEALIKGGINSLEITLRTKVSFKVLAHILKKYPELTVGAGTVLNSEQLNKVKDLGTHFAVSPGINPQIVRQAKEMNLPFFPGVATPSDIEMALENGCRYLKFFPAELLGGLNYLKSISAPYLHLGVKFIPLGGVKQNNLLDYLNSPLVSGIGGSWLAEKKLIQTKNWEEIYLRAAKANQLVKEKQS